MKSRINSILNELPKNVKLIAVSKRHSNETILQAYKLGISVFGENKPQELMAKHAELPKDIEWHMIGHLQRNKVKSIASFVHTIHAVDSLKLFLEIEKQAANNNREISCLIQFHIADEDSKFGFDMHEVDEILNSEEYKQCKYAKFCGVMGMATFTDDMHQVRREFNTLKSYYNTLKERYFSKSNDFKDISMGMSSDWKIAVEEGSTMVRIGTAVFGSRTYS